MASCSLELKKENFNLIGGFWANGIRTGACFLLNYMTSSSDPTRQFCLAVFFDSRPEYAFLEPLIEFPAFLVQKLGQKTVNWYGAFLNIFGGFP